MNKKQVFNFSQKMAFRIEVRDNNAEEPDNLVEEDLHTALKPFNTIQALHVCAKYKIKNGVITPNSLGYDVATIIASLSICCAFAFSQLSLYISILNVCNTIVFCMGFIINCFTNITQKQNNVSLIIIIQNIYKFFRNNENVLKKTTIQNWIWVIVVYLFFTLLAMYYFFVFDHNGILAVLPIYYIAFFDISLL